MWSPSLWCCLVRYQTFRVSQRQHSRVLRYVNVRHHTPENCSLNILLSIDPKILRNLSEFRVGLANSVDTWEFQSSHLLHRNVNSKIWFVTKEVPQSFNPLLRCNIHSAAQKILGNLLITILKKKQDSNMAGPYPRCTCSFVRLSHLVSCIKHKLRVSEQRVKAKVRFFLTQG